MGDLYFHTSQGHVHLRFDWGALAKLHAAFGAGWQDELRRAVSEIDTPAMANILACASSRDVDFWMNESPAIMAASEAIQNGLEIAFFGAGGAKPPNPLGPLRVILSILSRRR